MQPQEVQLYDRPTGIFSEGSRGGLGRVRIESQGGDLSEADFRREPRPAPDNPALGSGGSAQQNRSRVGRKPRQSLNQCAVRTTSASLLRTDAHTIVVRRIKRQMPEQRYAHHLDIAVTPRVYQSAGPVRGARRSPVGEPGDNPGPHRRQVGHRSRRSKRIRGCKVLHLQVCKAPGTVPTGGQKEK